MDTITQGGLESVIADAIARGKRWTAVEYEITLKIRYENRRSTPTKKIAECNIK